MRITDEEPVLDCAVLDVIRRTNEAEFSQQGVVYSSPSDPIPGWAAPGPYSFTSASYHASTYMSFHTSAELYMYCNLFPNQSI